MNNIYVVGPPSGGQLHPVAGIAADECLSGSAESLAPCSDSMSYLPDIK
jgi:hypothetical protein